MSGRTLTDAQIARALRAHLPAQAQAGLLDRVVAEAASTPQQRALPPFLAGLGDADPLARRRYQLIAATLLILLTLAVAAGVGALLDPDRRLPDALSLEPPADVAAYVTDAYEGLVDLPALSITIAEDEAGGSQFLWDGAGTLRLEVNLGIPGGADAYRLYTAGVMAEPTDVNGELVWVEYEGQLSNPLQELAQATGAQATCDAAWEYVALEYLIERPTHHVACGGSALWIDIETGLALKSINDQAPADLPTITFTVTELVIGPQPAELFVPPPGLAVMSDREMNCALDPACESPAPPGPSPSPLVSPPPAGEFDVPADLDAFVADVVAGYATVPALEMVVTAPFAPPDASWRHLYDGAGRLRLEWRYDPAEPPTVYLTLDGRWYESWGLADDGRSFWVVREAAGPGRISDFGLGSPCAAGWEHLGFDWVLDRPAHHLVCGYAEYWIDREWLVVTRQQANPDPLHDETFVSEVLELRFGALPADLFRLPDDAAICETPPGEGGTCPGGFLDSGAAPSPGQVPSPSG